MIFIHFFVSSKHLDKRFIGMIWTEFFPEFFGLATNHELSCPSITHPILPKKEITSMEKGWNKWEWFPSHNPEKYTILTKKDCVIFRLEGKTSEAWIFLIYKIGWF